ncbi:unnamed protein product, partial [marine sediment metagenome]
MNYSQAEEYLHSFIDYEKIPGISYASYGYSLKHVEELLHRMGDPHLAAKTVHVAGTKGKGSIAAMIVQVLIVSGYRTGLYTSPHFHTLRERIRVGSNLISEEEFAALMTEVKPYFEAMNHDPLYRQLTFFEVLTALAFAYFKQKQADFQVLEVGLGGRLDATNVAEPEVCAYKPNLAFYEALGIEGLIILEKTIKYMPADIPIIGDAKRGDIGNTAKAYAKALFSTLGFDAATVNPYLGFDSIEPFISYQDKGVFILCRTSNRGASDFQDLSCTGGLSLYEIVAQKVKEWNIYGNIGLVVGATYPEELKRVRS